MLDTFFERKAILFQNAQRLTLSVLRLVVTANKIVIVGRKSCCGSVWTPNVFAASLLVSIYIKGIE